MDNLYKEKSKKCFDKDADNYETTYNGKHAKKTYGVVLKIVKESHSKNLLDVGCGTGKVLSELKKYNSKIKLSGIDLSENMLSIAKKNLDDKVELKVGDSENLPWNDNTFDTILCTDSFHHYPNPEKVIKEMKRVLKKEGKVIIADPWMIMPLRVITNIMLRYSNSGDYKIYSKKAIISLLASNGFSKIQWKRINSSSFVVQGKINS